MNNNNNNSNNLSSSSSSSNNNNHHRRPSSSSPDSATRCKRSLLRDALRPGTPAVVVQFLLERGAAAKYRDSSSHDLLALAVKSKNAQKVQLLLLHCRPNAFSRSTLQQALSDAIFLASSSTYNDDEQTQGYDMMQALLPHVKANYAVMDSNHAMTTPLHCAIQYKAPVAVIRLLVEQGQADVNGRNQLHQVPLHLAALDDAQVDVVRYLMQQETTTTTTTAAADPNIVDAASHATPLHYAARRGHLRVVQALTCNGVADPNTIDMDWQTPLHYAILHNFIHVATWLVQHAGAAVVSHAGVPFFQVVSFHSLDSPDDDDDDDDDDDEQNVVAMPTFCMPKHLIALGIDPWEMDHRGNSALHFAVKTPDDFPDSDSEEAVEDDDEHDDHVERMGGGERRLRFIAELVKHDPKLLQAKNHRGETPLHLAASWSNLLVRTLVEQHGANLCAQDYLGRTPLIQDICKDEYPNRVECLLILMKEREVDINMGDKQGWAALHWALFLNHEAAVRLLVEFGANPNVRNTVGRTPLHLVGYPFDSNRQVQTFSDRDVTRILRAQRSNRNNASKDDDHLEAVQDLLSRGADATVRDAEGNLPFFLATATGLLNASFSMLRAGASQGLFDSRCCATAPLVASLSSSSSRTTPKRKPRVVNEPKQPSSGGSSKRPKRTTTRRTTRNG